MSNKVSNEETVWNPDESLYNADLAPVHPKKKTWTWWNYSTIWMGAVHSINQWIITAIMINQGMSFWQAFGVSVFVAGVVTAFLIANSFAGTKYGVPFPVLIRSAFGHNASLIPIFIRGILGVFHFGIFMYLASESIQIGFGAIIPGWNGLETIRIVGMGLNTFISYIISITLHLFLITHNIERIKRFELWAGPLIMIIAVGLVFWAINVADGLKPILTLESTIPKGQFFGLFVLSATGIIGTFSTLMVNNPDLTRFARSQKDQVIGHLFGFFCMFIFYSAISLIVTAGSLVAFGTAIFDPIQVVGQLNNPFLVFFGCMALMASVLGVNAATNAVAVGFDLAAVFPKTLNFSRAGIVAVILGVLSAPWLWYGDADLLNEVFGVLGATMGPLLGIMLVDFYLIRRRKYDINSLFMKDGLYSYENGWNIHALIAFAIGILVALIGLFVPPLRWLYSYNWFLGVLSGSLIYFILMSIKTNKK